MIDIVLDHGTHCMDPVVSDITTRIKSRTAESMS